MIDEFQMIHHYFQNISAPREDVLLGSGDDAALTIVPESYCLVSAIDTMVSGTHFFEDCPAADIAYKILSVNLSDIAAMGGIPTHFTCALTLPECNEQWLAEFAKAWEPLITRYQLALVGGDLTHGPLSITVQCHGIVKPEQAMLRSNATVGDNIYVTGALGGAAYALSELKAEKDITNALRNRLQRPTARVAEGLIIAESAQCAIDISDGLLQDLQHILRASGVGAEVNVDNIPLHESLSKEQSNFALHGGDDYELLFTASPHHDIEFIKKLEAIQCPVTHIGKITDTGSLACIDEQGSDVDIVLGGYQHFSS